MQNIKKYFMTLALLLMAATGAWAQSSPKVYTTQVTVDDLQVGDILAQGFSLVNKESEKGFYFDENRYKLNGGSISSSDWHDLISDITSYGENCTISIRSTGHPDKVFTPVDENGNDGNAWVVTKIDNGKPYISGITFELTEWSLTPDADKKVWTLAKMPANDIELQVEYYAESNLFLGKEALANKANISVLNGSTAVEFDDEGKSTATVLEGNTVTAKFTGKKVLGLKVTKRVSYPIAISAVTSDYIGSVVTTDGNVYATVAAATAASKTPVAMIAYVGTASDCAHGLAIALEDVSNEKLTWNNSGSNNESKTAAEWCSAWNTSKAVTGGTWRLPSISDWQYMFIGCGASESYSDNPIQMSYSGLASKLTTAQGGALPVNADYWSSTEASTEYLWTVRFGDSYAFFYNNTWEGKAFDLVRACLVF